MIDTGPRRVMMNLVSDPEHNITLAEVHDPMGGNHILGEGDYEAPLTAPVGEAGAAGGGGLRLRLGGSRRRPSAPIGPLPVGVPLGRI